MIKFYLVTTGEYDKWLEKQTGLEEIKMAKKKTLAVRKKSGNTTQKNMQVTFKPHDPIAELVNEELVRDAIWECLQKDDSAGVIEVLATYLEGLEMDARRRDAAMPRSTFYHSLKAKNPTLKTLAKIVSIAHTRPH